MGQLERYGLYVLCLVIFLILGVAIWGSDPQELNHSTGAGTGAGGSATPVAVKTKQDHIDDVEDFVANQQKNTVKKQQAAQNAIFKPAQVPSGPNNSGLKNSGTKSGGDFNAGTVPPQPEPKKDAVRYHTVQGGDTFSSIAKTYLGSADHWPIVQAANPGMSSKSLSIGKRVVVPPRSALQKKGSGASNGAPGAGTYVVKKNENPWTIARKFVGAKDATAFANKMLALNNISDARRVREGQVLKIPAK